MEKLPMEVKIVQDTCDGEYEHMTGQVVTVVEIHDTDDPNLKMYTVLTETPSINPYMEGKYEEIVASCDVEVISYHEIDNQIA